MSTNPNPVDFLALLDSIQEFIVVKDGAGRWLFCNKTALAAYEMCGFEYLGVTDQELLTLRPKFADGFARNIETDALAWRNRSATMVEKSFLGQDGRINTWEVVKMPSFNPDGTRDRLIIVSRNITERKLAETALQASEERFKNLAHVDALTGIPNRRGILDLISSVLDVSVSIPDHPDCSALIYMDLDRFKTINDQKGHEVGDELLIAFAKRTRACLRDSDLLGRIGGDEFVAFLPRTDRSQALIVAKRLCESLSGLWCLEGQRIYTSSSIGIAFHPHAGNDVHSLLRHADEALYRAKRAGRSQIKIYEAEPALENLSVSIPFSNCNSDV
ncbi:diguanylate cyclase domain-containing protein [Pseudomonas sp. D3-10]|uniref:diguanylate cyclase domain-containing protein n=1 Tax=Pseudomonas sp. D3-10 TaxID=2817392 RepID=UPI003DA8EA3A